MRQGFSIFARWLAPGALLLVAGCTADYPQTMLEPVTDYGRISMDLWGWVTWWTAGITIVVFVGLGWILFRYRERPDAPPPKPIYGSTKLELTWTIIPAVITAFIAVPTIQAIFETQADAPDDALVIEAIGHQWWWEFSYPELGITTANEFFVPTERPIEFRLRSADVIHSFWVPRLGGKRDVNPVVRTPEGVEPLHLNRITVTVDSAGEYLGQCAEYCGTSHAVMRMMGVAVDPDEFERWIEDFRQPVEPVGELEARGREIFLSSTCIACHAIEGTSAQGRLGPDLTLMGERFSIGAGLLENTPANLTEWIMRAPELKKGIIMPGAKIAAGGMAPTGLTRDQARAIAAYLSDLRRPLLGIRSPVGQAPEEDPGDPTAVAPAEPLNEGVPPEDAAGAGTDAAADTAG